MLLSAAAEGAAPDVVSQLFDQFRVLLLDLLRKLLPPVKNNNSFLYLLNCFLPERQLGIFFLCIYNPITGLPLGGAIISECGHLLLKYSMSERILTLTSLTN